LPSTLTGECPKKLNFKGRALLKRKEGKTLESKSFGSLLSEVWGSKQSHLLYFRLSIFERSIFFQFILYSWL